MDAPAQLADTQTKMAENMALQRDMQTLTLENNTEGAIMKSAYEAEMNSVKRLEKMADSAAAHTDAMTQAIQ